MRWLIFFLVSLPFIIPFRWYPDGDFFADAIAFFFALLIACITRKIRFSPIVLVGLMIALIIIFYGKIGETHYLEVWLAPALMVIVGALLLGGLQAQQSEKFIINKTFLLYGLAFGGGITLLLSLGQVFHLNFLENIIFKGSSGISANIGQRNQFSLYLLISFFAFLALLTRSSIPLSKGIISVLLIGFFLSIVITKAGSRAAVLMILIAASISITRLYWWRNDRLSYYVLAFAALFSIIQLTSIILPDLTFLFGRNSGLSRIHDAYSDTRWGEWLKAWYIFLKYPLGVGFGNYAYFSFINGQNQEIVWSNPHNIILHFLVETGVFGAFFVLCGLLLIIKNCIQLVRAQQGDIFFPCALAFFILHNMLEYSLWYANFFFLFIVLLAFLPSAGPSIRKTWVRAVPAMMLIILLMVTAQYGQLLRAVWLVGNKNPTERITVTISTAMNPFLSWRSDKSLMDYLNYDNGPGWRQHFCRLEIMVQREPLPHYLEKMALLAVINDKYNLAGSIFRTRYEVLSKMSDEHFKLIAKKTWPLAYKDLLDTVELKKQTGFRNHPKYQLGQSGLCGEGWESYRP